MSNLRLRSPEAINAMKVVDLLNYAAENLDNAVKATKESSSHKIKEMRDKVSQTTSDVLSALNNASEMMTRQISRPYQSVMEKTKQIVHIENEQDVHSFSGMF